MACRVGPSRGKHGTDAVDPPDPRKAFPVPGEPFPDADSRLFTLLDETNSDLAHARYLALLRQAASFADACHSARIE